MHPPRGAVPILAAKDYAAPSVFRPENLLREARRQKALPDGPIPEICVLDPDGDLVDFLCRYGGAERCTHWGCYHTELHIAQLGAELGGERVGVVGRAVGAAFAVLVAEQLFASGCRILFSITSSGQIDPTVATPTFVLIDRALRDEGTSYHYLPPSAFAEADPMVADLAMTALRAGGLPIRRGITWTTDAPFRETEPAIAAARVQGALAVEMEAAALYAFAQARGCPVLCFAHVTNQMGQVHGDFEKGEANGAPDALHLLAIAARAWRAGPGRTAAG